jgi:hypothetical protein
VKELDGRNVQGAVVIGTHGRSARRRFSLGTVAEKVVRHARCPVLTVAQGREGYRDGTSSEKILVPFDFSEQGLKKLTPRVDIGRSDSRASGRIAWYAQKNAFDLIVIASHGLTGIEHALLGSTTERVVRIATCPVLTVRSDLLGSEE